MKLFKYILVISLVFGSGLSQAFQDIFTLGELSSKLDASVKDGDQVVSLIGSEVMQSLQEAGVKLKEGELIFSLDHGEEEINGGCFRQTIFGNAELVVGSDSKMAFTLSSLNKPITASVDIVGEFGLDGHLRTYLGTRVFGRCIRWGRNTSDIGLDADVGVNMDFELLLNPRLLGNNQVEITPVISLDGNLYLFNIDADVDLVSGPLGVLLTPLDMAAEKIIEHYVGGNLDVNAKYQSFLKEKEGEWSDSFKNRIGIASGETSKTVQIPDLLNDITVEDVKKILTIINSSYISTFPVSYDYVYQNRRELLYYLLVGDFDGMKRILAESVACEMSEELLSEIGQPKVWSYSGGSCSQIAFEETYTGPYYSDANCQSQVNFSPENMARFCNVVADPDKATIGNPQKWVSGEDENWTVSPGTRIDMVVNHIDGNTQPVMKRENYKSMYFPDLYEITGKIDNLFNPYDPFGPPVGHPLESNSVDGRDRQEIFDLCMEASVGLGKIVNKAPYDPFSYQLENFSCLPEFSTLDLSQTITPSSWDSRQWRKIGVVSNMPYYVSYNNGNYEIHREESFLLGSIMKKIDVTQDSYYYHALDMIEQYGISKGAVVKTQDHYTCDLEMRVYKKDINATNLKPLLAIHGGAWKYRGFGFAGLESQISNLTEQGFAVFTPFYRLAGESEGNTECNGYTWEDITSDAESALDWVIAHGSVFGANVNNGVAVFGQSAGGHLGGWLAVNQASKVSKAMLMYPPVDFEHYITETRNGNIYSEQGKAIIETFIGDTFDKLDVYGSAVQANSYPQKIAGNPNAYPPVYLIHGSSDDLVPVEQSIRMCAAFNGSVASSLSQNPDGSYSCGSNGGKLNIIPGAEHALEICVEGAVCLAGDEAKAREAIDNGVQWLAQ